jgi:dihydrofolate reductase
MRSIRYAVAASLDGYIAGPRGESDWIPMDPEVDFRAIASRYDTLLMGRRTYEVARQGPGGGSMPGMKTIVVSRTLRPDDHPSITIIGQNLAEAIGRLRAAPGKDIWLFGGGALFASLLALGQVDAVEVAVVPILLGGGLPLLPPGTERMKLKLVSHKVYNTTGIVALEYQVRH